MLLPTNLAEDDADASILPESISITRVDDLLSQMRFHEVPKRALFSVPFELAKGFVIGVKGCARHLHSWSCPGHLTCEMRAIRRMCSPSYGLITEQRKGSYKYFVDLGDRMEVATARTVYVDEVHDC